MCWSGEASAALAAAGLLGTGYAAYRKEPTVLWMALGYFSLMELLQAFTYSVIDECGNPSNQVATLLGYFHITFQPFFINAVSMHFINQRLARKISPLVYSACFGAAIMLLIRVYPFSWAGQCQPGDILCGDRLCSVHGSWHIAWLVPLNAISEYVPWYYLVGFLLPVLYGSWRFTLYHLITGPLLARATTANMNEWPAVWCLLSIGLLLIVVKTPVRRLLYSRHHWYWKKLKEDPAPAAV